MNKKNNFLYFLLLFLILLVIFFYFNLNLKNDNIEDEQNNLIQSHIGRDISNILSEENYEKIGINPEKYNNFKDFLIDFKSFSGVQIDPINENFTIGIENGSGKVLYIPFNFQKNEDLFNDKLNKNLAIIDIYKSYKEGMIFGGLNSKYGNKVVFENEFNHPETSELEKIFSTELNVFNYINELEKSGYLGKSKTELLSYLYDFIGQYDNANKKRDIICKDFNDCKEIELTISGTIKNSKGEVIKGAKIENLNNSENYSYSKEDGTYSLKIKVFPFTHLRFKSSLLGYSDGFSNYSLNSYFNNNKNKSIVIDFNINEAHNTFHINNENKDKYLKGKYYVIDDNLNSKYFIPIDGLYYFDGKKYTKNDFVIYNYQFTKWSNMENLLENDTFEPVYGYVGNIMKTFGMPYIQFFDKESKKELFIKSSNPMILQNQIYHMQELYDNYDNIYEAITQKDMEFLVDISEKSEEPYPIDFDFLTENNFLRWPAWWSLDRKTGIWSNVGQRVLTKEGLVELPFYSIKDN